MYIHVYIWCVGECVCVCVKPGCSKGPSPLSPSIKDTVE